MLLWQRAYLVLCVVAIASVLNFVVEQEIAVQKALLCGIIVCVNAVHDEELLSGCPLVAEAIVCSTHV